jgi:acyl dehydratase
MDRPILHGLCTFGFAGRAVLEVAGAGATLTSMSARFAGPVWPGDRLDVDLWNSGDQTVRFAVRGREGKHVLTDGVAKVR